MMILTSRKRYNLVLILFHLSFLGAQTSFDIQTWLGTEPDCEGNKIGCEYFDMIRIGQSQPCIQGQRIRCALRNRFSKFKIIKYTESMITNNTEQFSIVHINADLPREGIIERICRIPELDCLNNINIVDLFAYHGWPFNSLYKRLHEDLDVIIVANEVFDISAVERYPSLGINMFAFKFSPRQSVLIIDLSANQYNKVSTEKVTEMVKNFTKVFKLEDDKYPMLVTMHYDSSMTPDRMNQFKLIFSLNGKSLYMNQANLSNYLVAISPYAVEGVLYIDEETRDLFSEIPFNYCQTPKLNLLDPFAYVYGKSKDCQTMSQLNKIIDKPVSLQVFYLKRTNK